MTIGFIFKEVVSSVFWLPFVYLLVKNNFQKYLEIVTKKKRIGIKTIPYALLG